MRKGRVEGPGTVRGWPLLGVINGYLGIGYPAHLPSLGARAEVLVAALAQMGWVL